MVVKRRYGLLRTVQGISAGGKGRLCKAQREDFLGQPFDGNLAAPFFNLDPDGLAAQVLRRS